MAGTIGRDFTSQRLKLRCRHSAPRSPMGHYHQVDQWFQPDASNGCTISGCHEPLPHGPKIKVAAFANFHTTFLDCRMCHVPAAHPTTARWISTDTNRPAEIPVILQLMAYLEQNAGTTELNPTAANATITALLQQTVITLGGDGMLDQLLSQMQSTQPGSPVWKDAASELSTNCRCTPAGNTEPSWIGPMTIAPAIFARSQIRPANTQPIRRMRISNM